MEDTNTKYFLGIALVVLVVLIGWYYYASIATPVADQIAVTESTDGTAGETSSPMPVPGSNTPEMVVEPDRSPQPTGATVTYTASGFVPQTVTITRGQSVTFIDQSGRGMWVASALHPTHASYSGTTLAEHCPDTTGTAFDQCAAGETYTFMFTKAGTWRYHNHVTGGDPGTVVVQ